MSTVTNTKDYADREVEYIDKHGNKAKRWRSPATALMNYPTTAFIIDGRRKFVSKAQAAKYLAIRMADHALQTLTWAGTKNLIDAHYVDRNAVRQRLIKRATPFAKKYVAKFLR